MALKTLNIIIDYTKPGLVCGKPMEEAETGGLGVQGQNKSLWPDWIHNLKKKKQKRNTHTKETNQLKIMR